MVQRQRDWLDEWIEGWLRWKLTADYETRRPATWRDPVNRVKRGSQGEIRGIVPQAEWMTKLDSLGTELTQTHPDWMEALLLYHSGTVLDRTGRWRKKKAETALRHALEEWSERRG